MFFDKVEFVYFCFVVTTVKEPYFVFRVDNPCANVELIQAMKFFEYEVPVETT